MSGASLGRRGELLAAEFLRGLGYTIIGTNERTRQGELDLVARSGGELVFVEVKTRRRGGSVSGEQAITPTKLRRIEQLALQYLNQRGLEHEPWRIEVVSVVLDPEGVPHDVRLIRDLS